MTSRPITLAAAKSIRESKQPVSRSTTKRGITDAQLARLANIPIDRIKALESLSPDKAEEPWLDEAYRIACVLGVGTLEALIGGSTMMRDLDTGFDAHDPLEVWQTGVRLPMRFGILIGRLFHMEPFDLITIPAVCLAIGRVAASGERTGGVCPWCVQDIIPTATVGNAGHLPTCIMGNLYHPRDVPVASLGVAPKPRKPGVRSQGSKLAPGLKRLREAQGVTQEVFAASIQRNPAYYSRLESLHDPLNTQLAEVICATYKVDMLSLYAP